MLACRPSGIPLPSGLDWFFFDPDGDNDRATDLKDEVFVNDLPWLLDG